MTGSLSQTRGRPEPGRDLDALIAEKVMGFTWDESRCRICGWHLVSDAASGCVLGNCSLRPSPAKRADSPAPYSTDIAAAWQVVEKMETLGWDGMVRRVSDGYAARFDAAHAPYLATASVDPRDGGPAYAICVAALAAFPDNGGRDA